VISGRIVNECCIAPGIALACIGNIGRVHAGADRRRWIDPRGAAAASSVHWRRSVSDSAKAR